MGAYPNVNKVLKILYIDSQKMRLEDIAGRANFYH